MSYCRWSSNNSMCDVYVYEDVAGGWTTHVAAKRRVLPPIPSLPLGRVPNRIWALWERRVRALSLRLIPMRRIGLLYDGCSFNEETPGYCADLLEELRDMGYRVPQHAIDALREEEAVGKPAVDP
jgi:hypothetical protein